MKTKIVIANVLKPVDDVRTFQKIAQSIAKANKYHINIIGNGGKKESIQSDITFHPHFVSKQSVLQRLKIRAQVLRKIFRLDPSILIIQTHELLFISLTHKLLKGSKVIYDVREDYKKNIQFLSPLPGTLRFVLAKFIRLKESVCVPFIDQFWLAEKCYSYEIGFTNKKSFIIENKALHISRSRKDSPTLTCLFSGTISRYGGVFQAIEAFRKIKKQTPEAHLKIVGQCHDQQVVEDLREAQNNDSAIQLSISEHSVPHNQIVEQIFSSTLGLIAYQPNEVNRNKLPTKLYEYSRYGLPYLIQQDTAWEQKAKELGGAIPIDYNSPNVPFILDQVKNLEHLFPGKYPDNEMWESQEEILYTSLNTLLNN